MPVLKGSTVDRKVKDITGKRYGRLMVLGFSHGEKNKPKYWLCRCDCGAEKAVAYSTLTNKMIPEPSCGCYKRERLPYAHRTHGESRRRTPEYTAWASMRQRCNDQGNKDFHRYGGRGISIDARWDDFAAFLADMGSRPSPKHSVDRIDVNGPYSPDNCQWATERQQRMNKRNTVFIEIDGESRPLVDVCRERGVNYTVAWRRWRAGYDPFVPVPEHLWRARPNNGKHWALKRAAATAVS